MQHVERAISDAGEGTFLSDMQTPIETEVKIALPRSFVGPLRLHALGFHEQTPRIFESNTLLDTPGQQLRQNNMLLRVRQAGAKYVLTWKGKSIDGPHKSRPELETTVHSADTVAQIFGHLGFTPVFRYEKFRTEYAREDRSGVVTFDETPIGNFLELEGEGDWINGTASELGFASSDYILESYGKLFANYCAQHGLNTRDMTFAAIGRCE